MPLSISTSDLAWSTPDGHSVLSHLDLAFGLERTGIVGRNGVGKTTLLRLLARNLVPTGGRIIASGSIAVLRQTVRADADDSIADLFGARAGLALLRRAEAGDADADELADADWTLETRIMAALAQVGLDAALDTRLVSLSGGQCTRAAMAAALYAEPDFLLLDEPTNNLDRAGRALLLDILRGWRAGAIVVSHDRELLEAMDAIVELTTLGATRYGGNWSQYRARKAIELAAARHDLDVAERKIAVIARTTQTVVERKQRRDGAGKRDAAQGGMPRILIGARKQRAENSGGDNARLADRQRAAASAAASAARARIEILETLGIALAPTGLTSDKVLVRLDHVTAGYAETAPVIRDLSLTIAGPERIAIDGPNGSGKTTLLALIAGALQPSSGKVERMVRFVMLDQTAALLDREQSIAGNFKRLNPGTDDNGCRAALARFGFRADAALQIAGNLSGGQMLRAALACVLGGDKPPPLLLLDEPTNYLDLDSIAAIEAGLSAYDGALLVVSHDRAFLDAIGITREILLPA